MTILDQITREAESLSAKERRHALKLIRSLRPSVGNGENGSMVRTTKTLGKARKAIKAVQGAWKDRTDLPRDTVEASMELRRRVMRRGKNG